MNGHIQLREGRAERAPENRCAPIEASEHRLVPVVSEVPVFSR